jgi:hypothetical protein
MMALPSDYGADLPFTGGRIEKQAAFDVMANTEQAIVPAVA